MSDVEIIFKFPCLYVHNAQGHPLSLETNKNTDDNYQLPTEYQQGLKHLLYE